MITIKIILLNLILLASAHVFSQPLNNNKTVSLNCSEKPLRLILENIRTQTGINFVYQDKLTNNLNVTCKIKNYTLDNALRKILDKTEISYKYYQANSVVLFKVNQPIQKPSRATVIKQDVPLFDSTALVSVHTFSMPKMISSISALYPPEAVKNNIEGDVKVKFLVDTTGNVSSTVIERTSGYSILDSAAIGYLFGSKFIPAKADGKPKNRWLSLLFKYSIK